jgi:putative nucleotidyltransferase with HDIG domain
MKLKRNENVIDILEKALNYVDERLMDHGKRVAYLMYKTLSRARLYEGKELRDICLLGVLHDVGAYKTEEIDKMVVFETVDVWEHSIYGYLFLSCFSPLKDLADVVLYHHANCDEVRLLENEGHQMLAQLMSLCDRADIFAITGGIDAAFKQYVEKQRDKKYRGDVVDMFMATGISVDGLRGAVDADEGFKELLSVTSLTGEEVDAYLKMIIYAIDFRSRYTVIHTVGLGFVAIKIAELLGVDADGLEKIRTGALLHDIGKIGIPVSILDFPGKLSDPDMAKMRTHIELSEKILRGNVDEEILNIAINHHEKLDGSGYHRRLSAPDIAFHDRIVAVADIFEALCGIRSYKTAFPKEKIIGIISGMSEKGLIDKDISELVIEQYDIIAEDLHCKTRPVFALYNALNEDFAWIREDIARRLGQQ